MSKLGGIPVNRRAHQSLVLRMTEKFKSSDYLVLAVSPEGSRGNVVLWKSGFYHIASQSEVPIGLGYLDYDRKLCGLGMFIIPSGNVNEDMDKIQLFIGILEASIRTLRASRGFKTRLKAPAWSAQKPVLAVRGISDIVGFKRSPEWTSYACHTAASFLVALLRGYPPISPAAKMPAGHDVSVHSHDEVTRERIESSLRLTINPHRTHHYTARALPLLGRDKEIDGLRNFTGTTPNFQWMQIARAGGQGKSRLALEIAIELQKEGWHAGFLQQRACPLASYGRFRSRDDSCSLPLALDDESCPVVRSFPPEFVPGCLYLRFPQGRRRTLAAPQALVKKPHQFSRRSVVHLPQAR